MNTPIPLCQYNILTIWERRGHAKEQPKYFVTNHETCTVLEEFRRLSSARKWANENKNG